MYSSCAADYLDRLPLGCAARRMRKFVLFLSWMALAFPGVAASEIPSDIDMRAMYCHTVMLGVLHILDNDAIKGLMAMEKSGDAKLDAEKEQLQAMIRKHYEVHERYRRYLEFRSSILDPSVLLLAMANIAKHSKSDEKTIDECAIRKCGESIINPSRNARNVDFVEFEKCLQSCDLELGGLLTRRRECLNPTFLPY